MVFNHEVWVAVIHDPVSCQPDNYGLTPAARQPPQINRHTLGNKMAVVR